MRLPTQVPHRGDDTRALWPMSMKALPDSDSVRFWMKQAAGQIQNGRLFTIRESQITIHERILPAWRTSRR